VHILRVLLFTRISIDILVCHLPGRCLCSICCIESRVRKTNASCCPHQSFHSLGPRWHRATAAWACLPWLQETLLRDGVRLHHSIGPLVYSRGPRVCQQDSRTICTWEVRYFLFIPSAIPCLCDPRCPISLRLCIDGVPPLAWSQRRYSLCYCSSMIPIGHKNNARISVLSVYQYHFK